MADGNGDWFAPKRFGYGAGAPVAWQGWTALGLYIAALMAAGLTLLPGHWTLWVIMLVILTLAFTAICAQHTRGGWKWRWGGEE